MICEQPTEFSLDSAGPLAIWKGREGVLSLSAHFGVQSAASSLKQKGSMNSPYATCPASVTQTDKVSN